MQPNALPGAHDVLACYIIPMGDPPVTKRSSRNIYQRGASKITGPRFVELEPTVLPKNISFPKEHITKKHPK